MNTGNLIMMIYARVPRSKPKRKPKNVEITKKVVAQAPLKRLTNYNLSIPGDRISPDYKSVDTGVTGALTKSGIMRDYHKLSDEDRKIVEKVGQCLAPLHKGNYIYVSEGMNPASLGRKNEVL